MIVAEALRAGAARLAESSDTARLDAEILMAHSLGISRSALLLHHIQDDAPAAFDAYIARRAAHEPVAYITGEQEFYGRTFRVSRDVLIPRADSETVVDVALRLGDEIAEAGAADHPNLRVLDLGTGSGALLLSVLAERPDWHGVGIDNSEAALAVAGENAAQLVPDGRAELLERDWRASDWQAGLGEFELIIANPPYVEADAPLAPNVKEYEPHSALFAGPEGLDDYKMLIPQLPGLLSEHGAAVLEIGATQAEAVSAIAQQEGFATSISCDLGGRPRAIGLTLRCNAA